MDRVSKENYYLDIAEIVSERSTCLRRRFGSIIVKNDSIVATGYNVHHLFHPLHLRWYRRGKFFARQI